jgi:hypothetical protein
MPRASAWKSRCSSEELAETLARASRPIACLDVLSLDPSLR